MSYADSHDLKTHDISAIAKHLADLPKKNTKRKRVAIVTQGTDATVVAVQGEDQVKTFPVHEIAKGEIVDTTGAGDAFAGGFLAGVAKAEKLETCVDMGQWLAAQSLRELGPSYVSCGWRCQDSADCSDSDTLLPKSHTQPRDRAAARGLVGPVFQQPHDDVIRYPDILHDGTKSLLKD